MEGDPMSMHGAGQCRICGAWSDYCTLEPPAGPSVDCRDLMLKPGIAPMYESDAAIDTTPTTRTNPPTESP